MKKRKILLSVVMLFAMFIFVCKVNAAGLPTFGIDLRAKAPNTESLPSETTQLKALTTDKFDFSKVTFKKKTSGTIAGTDHMRKIIVGQLENGKATKYETVTATPTDGQSQSEAYAKYLFGDNWFTAYCLDNSMDYPYHGVLNNLNIPDLNGTLTLEQKRNVVTILTRIAFLNDDNMKSVISNYESKINGDPYNIAAFFYDSSSATGTNRSLIDESVADQIINNFKAGNDFTIKLSVVLFFDPKTNTEASYASSDAQATACGVNATGYLSSNQNADYVSITTNFRKIAFHNYNATKPNGTVKNYNHALWIVEHSYPTLDINTALTAAGADYNTLNNWVKTLYSLSTDEEAAEYTENVVFSTVQYAIWKVTGNIYGEEIGSGEGVTNSTELTKLFNYLVDDTRDYSNYDKPGVFSNTIDISKPTKILYKEENDYNIYGPFVATYNALVNDQLTITVTNEDKTGITVIDTNGNEITKIDSGKMFYFKVKKTVKGKVTFEASINNVITFSPQSNRGRIYYPMNGQKGFQNTLSGGKIEPVSLSVPESFDIMENPKTGVENIALLLMITLVAFTLGYLVLSYKSKPIQLNQ